MTGACFYGLTALNI